MEIFCGKAKLSKHLRLRNFQVVSVDHISAHSVPILRIDITKPHQCDILESLLELDSILYVHFAPPCGTASAAREIRPGPPPLRSWEMPLGLPNLTQTQQLRVDLANKLYNWTAMIAQRLNDKHVGWSIENPAGSLMWATPAMVALSAAIPDMIAFSFHTCMFSAPRKKDTAIWTNVPELKQYLERKCDGAHPHEKWGTTPQGFATAEECAYNDSMSASWACGIYEYALKQNFHDIAQQFHDVHLDDFTPSVNKTILGCLPRGRRLPPLLTECLLPQCFSIAEHPLLQTLPLGKRIPDDCNPFSKGAKLISFCNADGGKISGEESKNMPSFAMIGLPREPWEFVKEACSLQHPYLMSVKVGEALLNNIRAYESNGGLAFRRTQCAFSKEMLSLIRDLDEDERMLHGNMAPHLRRILKPKRILVFQHLLEKVSYPDAKIAREMAGGFALCGWLPASGVFPTKLKPPEIHEDFLAKMSKPFSARSLAVTKSSGDSESDCKLWEATLEEVAAGFLSGPYHPDDAPAGAVISPRFGLQQKNKLRPIDNFSSSHVNGATGMQDKLQLDSVDEICGMIKAWMQEARGPLSLKGRCYDLRKAYRQIGVKPEHLHLAWISVFDPSDQKAKVFRMESMPFGASASVGAFLRLSLAIKVLGIVSCSLVWSSFYDDFVCICKDGTEQQTDRMVRMLFSCLGWTLSTDPSKDVDFSTSFQALGVEFDLTNVPKGFFTVGNTASRREELVTKINAILAADSISPSEAQSMRSRLLFAEAQLFGRFAKQALHVVGKAGLRNAELKPLDREFVISLRWMRDRVLTGRPRQIDCHHHATFFLFLDGACTPKTASEPWSGTSIGGVLVDGSGNPLSFFGHVLSEEWVRTWSEKDRSQNIFEAEVLPYLISLRIWSRILSRTCIFVFIDNEAARAAWITGFAHSNIAQQFLSAGTALEADLEIHPFFARVPTHSNLGDDPSRGRFSDLEARGASRILLDDQYIRDCATPLDRSVSLDQM